MSDWIEQPVVLCPRCQARPVIHAVLSRTTRDDGAEIDVCPHCGELEAITEAAGRLAPFAAWPLTPDRLADEERAFYKTMQRATIRRVEIHPDDER